MRHYRIAIFGIVQGVGFRPFVFSLATRLGLNGFVRNIGGSVEILLFNINECDLENFVAELSENPPQNARISEIKTSEIPPSCVESCSGFRILESAESSHLCESLAEFGSDFWRGENGGEVLDSAIPLDLAICENCEREVADSSDRRHNYAFINCINCGPRYTILRKFPYDRENTAMSSFKMCEECESEYNDASNRRFHAQPNSCKTCGITLSLFDNLGECLAVDSAALGKTRKFLEQGKILAIKGVGGFNLVCRADFGVGDSAIKKLREFKNRPRKPFAVMFRDLEHLSEFFNINEREVEILNSPSSPIVLLNKAKLRAESVDLVESSNDIGNIAESVAYVSESAQKIGKLSQLIAPQIPTIGVILAYSPLHKLLFCEDSKSSNPSHASSHKAPLIFTSANLGGEPLICDKDSAFSKLSGGFEALLDYNREILNPIDDSLVNLLDCGVAMILRGARGLFPLQLKSDFYSNEVVLALGAHQKSQIGIFYKDKIIISPYIGDLESVASVERFRAMIDFLLSVYNLVPQVILCDMNSSYQSHKEAHTLARRFNAKLCGVYHHRAHFYSVIVEHNLWGKNALGVVFDGSGVGEDSTIWGGEIFKTKTSPLGNLCGSEPFVSLQRTASPLHSPKGSQPTNLIHDARILKSNLPHSHTAKQGEAAVSLVNAGSLESHSSCSKFCENPTLHSLQRTQSASHSLRLDNSQNLSTILECENLAKQNLEFNENLESSLRESKANEAIYKNTDYKDSKLLDSRLDCHEALRLLAMTAIQIPTPAITKILNKIYNFLFPYNLIKWRSPKKCDKFHNLGLQGIAGKWRSPKMKGDFKGGTLPPLDNTHEVRISGEAIHQNDKNNCNEVAAQFKKSESEAERKIESNGLPRSLTTSRNDRNKDSSKNENLESTKPKKQPKFHKPTHILHFKKFPLLGGDNATKDISRVALGVFFGFYGREIPLERQLWKHLKSNDIDLFFAMYQKGLNSPLSSSVGRLFDCIAFLCGLDYQSYEGESGVYIENLCDEGITESYAYEIVGGEIVVDFDGIVEDLKTLHETSPLGSHLADFENFNHKIDTKSYLGLKFSKNSQSTTATAGSLDSTLHSLQPPNLTHDARILNSNIHSHTANAKSLEASEILKSSLRESKANEANHNTDSNFERSDNKINATLSQIAKSVVGGEGESCERGRGERLRHSSPLSLSQSGINGSNEVAARDEKDSTRLPRSLTTSRNDNNTKNQINNNPNKIYNFLFLRNLVKWRSPKKCDKFHSLELQGIVGKWRSPFTKGDFKGGTLPLLYNMHEVRIIGGAEQNIDSSDLQNHNKINLHEVQQPLKASSEERVRVVREGEENDFAFVRSTNPHLQIQVSSPSLKVESIENPCEKDSNKNEILESSEILSLSLRESEANEAIYKNADFKVSKFLDFNLDCHEFDKSNSRNDKNIESKKDSVINENLNFMQNLSDSTLNKLNFTQNLSDSTTNENPIFTQNLKDSTDSTKNKNLTLKSHNPPNPTSSLIASKFLNTLANIIAHIAETHNDIDGIAFSGGVFQNKTLCDKITAKLHAQGVKFYLNSRVSPNDGGICLGQIGAFIADDCIDLEVKF